MTAMPRLATIASQIHAMIAPRLPVRAERTTRLGQANRHDRLRFDTFGLGRFVNLVRQ